MNDTLNALAAQQIRAAMIRAGIEDPPDEFIADGAIHRFSTSSDPKDDAGWYVVYAGDIPAGAYGCWRGGISEKWHYDPGRPLTAEELGEIERKTAEARRLDEVERERGHAAARTHADDTWKHVVPETGEHRYLRDKGVNAYGIRTDGHQLVISLRDTAGVLHSLQFITPDHKKRFLKAGRVQRCYYMIGEPDGTLCVCEGYATGASIHEATGYAVAVAFNKGNLKPVAHAAQAKYPKRRIIIAADDDYRTAGNPGVSAALAAARAVGGMLAVPAFGELRPDGATGFNDLHQQHGLEAVKVHIDTAQSPPQESLADVAARLAKLSRAEYEHIRKAEAERLGVRTSTLDAEVAKRRPKSDSDKDDTQGSEILFPEPEAWPETVDGAALLDELAETFKRYLVLATPAAADALTLWATHTHVFDAFEHTPRLNVKSPEKECGKTQLLDVTETLVRKGIRTENVTTAVLFRLIEAEAPTVLIDEYDSRLRDDEELRGALNAGQKRGGRALRCVGDTHKLRGFKVFAPVALAGIGSLPGTLDSRSIIIRMQRAKPGEIRQRFDSRKTAREQELKRKLIRWTQDNRHRLEASDPEMPGLYNRPADTWRPLFAIAACAGGEWPEKVKKAVTALTDTSDESESAGVMLLADICQIFCDTRRAKLASTWLVDRLNNMKERPWPEYRRGEGINTRQVAKLLRPFGIISGPRRDGDDVFRGYELEQFISVFSSYLPAESVTTLQAALQSHLSGNSSVTNRSDVTHEKAPEPAPDKCCNGVTDRKGGNRQERHNVDAFCQGCNGNGRDREYV